MEEPSPLKAVLKSRWWFHFFFHPYLGRWSILTSIIFNWVVQPPTRISWNQGCRFVPKNMFGNYQPQMVLTPTNIGNSRVWRLQDSGPNLQTWKCLVMKFSLRKKQPALLSIESWLVYRDPSIGLLKSSYNWVGFHPQNQPKQAGALFSLLKWNWSLLRPWDLSKQHHCQRFSRVGGPGLLPDRRHHRNIFLDI